MHSWSSLPLTIVLIAGCARPEVETGADEGPPEGLCPAWFGAMTQGSVREYSHDEDCDTCSSGWWRTTATVDGSVILLQSEGVTTGQVEVIETAETKKLICDEAGVSFAWRHRASTTTQMDGIVVTQWSDMTYDPPALLMPRGAEAGSVWRTYYVGESSGSDGLNLRYDFSARNELLAGAEVTVATGTFDALVWQRISSMTDDMTVGWQARGPGSLENLVAYEP